MTPGRQLPQAGSRGSKSQIIISMTYKHSRQIFLVKINSGTRKRLQNGDNVSLQRTRVILRSLKRNYDQSKPYYRITLAPFWYYTDQFIEPSNTKHLRAETAEVKNSRNLIRLLSSHSYLFLSTCCLSTLWQYHR